MLEQVEEQHKDDEDRFKKLQVQDTATLNDRMDQLTVCAIRWPLERSRCMDVIVDVRGWPVGTHEHRSSSRGGERVPQAKQGAQRMSRSIADVQQSGTATRPACDQRECSAVS